MRHGLAFICIAVLASQLSGCSKSLEDKLFEAAKCRKAALNVDDLAFREGTERELDRLSQSLDKKAQANMAFISMQTAQRVNEELFPRGTRNHQYTAMKLNEWYQSSYCQSLRSR